MNRSTNQKGDKNSSKHKPDKPMIMVVDDENSVLRMTELILEEEGYQVEPCLTGKEAIDKFNESINAVILDISLPDLSGLQVFEKVKAINPYVPIIFHTGGTTHSDDRRDIRRQLRPHAYVYKGR